MSADTPETSSDPEKPLYLGALATGVIALLPYLNVFILPAYVIGAFVGVRAAVRQRPLFSFKEGAKLGFLSTLLGSMVAVVLVDLIWVLSDYQLWQHQNAQLLLAIVGRFAGPVTLDTMASKMAEQAGRPFQWYMIIAQFLGNAFLCGVFGTLSGVLATKIFRPRAIR